MAKYARKQILHVLACCLLLMLCTASTLRKEKAQKSVYIFGLAASFNDSVVYYTDIRVVDSVALDANGFLPRRELYSYQLKNYLEFELKKPNYTCMVFFSENKKKLEKEATKVKNKYTKEMGITLQAISPDEFTFNKADE